MDEAPVLVTPRPLISAHGQFGRNHMYSRPQGHCGQQQPTLSDIARHLEGAAQALNWLYLAEDKRHPVLAVAAFHLSRYASATQQAVAANDTDTLDEFMVLRLGTLSSLLSIIHDQWAIEFRPATVWSVGTLAEIAHWLEWSREAIRCALRGQVRA